MSLTLVDVDDVTRRHMVAELDQDVAAHSLFVGARLSPWGRKRWPDLLRKALAEHDDGWLAQELARPGWLNTVELMTFDGGRVRYWRRMPADAAERLAALEFNRFAMRGVCARAMAEGMSYVVVYRARATQPRGEVRAKIGRALNAAKLLEDLRARRTLEEILHTPDAFSAGLSVRLGRAAVPVNV